MKRKHLYLFPLLCVIMIFLSLKATAATTPTRIALYFLDSDYEKYISISNDVYQKYKIPLKGSKSDYIITMDGDTVEISDNLTVTPAKHTTFVIGGLSGTVTEKELYEEGVTKVTIKSKTNNKTWIYEFDCLPYTEYYAEKVMQMYINNNINSSMNQKEKLEKICQFVCNYPYHTDHSGFVSMIVTGEGGDCWASASTIVEMAKMVGLKARYTSSEYVSVFTGGHIVPVVMVDGKYALVEANIQGNILIDNDEVYSCERSYAIDYYDSPFVYYESYDWEADETSICIEAYLGFGGNITVPEKFDGYYVKSIDSKCFYLAENYLGDDHITSVKLPDTLTNIGASAFYDCSEIKKIHLGPNVKEIGMGAFSGCNSLELEIDNNNPYFYADNNAGILYNKDMTALICGYNLKNTDVKIPYGVKYIEDCAFWGSNITNVTFPETLENIAYGAFTYSDELYGNDIIIPKNVTGIGYAAFYDTNLSSITILNPNCVINNTTENNLCDQEDGNTLGGSSFYGTTTIYGEPNSTAEEYVKKYGIETTYWSDGTVEKNRIYEFKKICHTYLETGNHVWSSNVTKTEPTCTKNGVYTRTCTECGEKKSDQIKKLGHSYKTVTTKATMSKAGSIVKKCAVCGKVDSNTAIAKIKFVKLSKKKFTYNGKAQKPTVTVKDSNGKTLKQGTDYTVKYSSGCKNVGQYTVTVKFKGNYSGTKTLTFTIVPKGTSVSKLAAGKKQFSVKWKKQATQTSGYEIQYSTSSKMKNAKTVTIKKTGTTSTTVKKLKSGKKYYVRVRTYKTVKINGKSVKLYSSWSSIKNIKTK